MNANAQFRCREIDYRIDGICLRAIQEDCFNFNAQLNLNGKTHTAFKIYADNSTQFVSISGDFKDQFERIYSNTSTTRNI